MLLTDAVIAFDGLDLSGLSNQVMVDFTRTDLDGTVFGAGGKLHRAGMMGMTAQASGFWDETVDAASAILAPTVHDLVIAPDAAVGTPAFIAGVDILASSLGGAVDTIAPWSATFASRRGRMARRGVVAYYAAPSDVDAGAGIQLGALDTGEHLTMTVHTFAVTGEADIEVQSHTSNGWSEPTSEATETIDALGVVTKTVDGPVTNTWWRVAFTGVDGASAFLVTLHRH